MILVLVVDLASLIRNIAAPMGCSPYFLRSFTRLNSGMNCCYD